MEKTIVVADDMEGQAKDIVDLQTFAQSRDDHTVHDGIDPGVKYWGFGVTQSTATEVQVAPGRYYTAGKTYAREETVDINMFSMLPLVTKKIVAIVSWGTDQPNRTEQRSFMTDAETEQTEPRDVAIEMLRYAKVEAVQGVESASPQQPVVDATMVTVAWVTLDPTGIVEISMNEDARLPSVAKNLVSIKALEDWRKNAGTRIETLATDLSSLADRTAASASNSLLEAALFDVARVRDSLDLPATYNNYGAEFFVHTEDSDTDRSGFDCEIQEGLSFADDAADVQLVELFNQYDNSVESYSSGIVIPKHTEEVRVQATGFGNSSSLTEYSVRAWALVKRTHSRFRKRYGRRYVTWKGESRLHVLRRTKAGPNAEPPGSKYPVAPLVFRKSKSGELKTVYQSKRKIKYNGVYRRDSAGRWYRSDWWSEPYWTFIRQDLAVNGAIRAQTFLNSQDGYMTSIGLYFVTKAASGNVRVMICDTTEQGTPDIEGVLSETTLDHSDIKVAGNGSVETKVSLDPVLLKTGRRYAIVLLSEGAHHVAMAHQVSYNAGSWFSSSDGSFFAGSQTQDLKFNAYFASFENTYIQVPLGSLSLSGGIANIDIIGEGHVPEGTDLVFEVKAQGQPWIPMEAYNDEDTTGPLTSLPPLLEFRAVMSGTRELMPFVNLASTQQYISRQKTTFTWFQEPVTLSANSDVFTAKLILNEFDDVDHDCTVYLEDQANTGTWIAADTVQDRVLDDRQIERTCTWALGSPIAAFALKVEGTTAEAIDQWTCQELSWVAA